MALLLKLKGMVASQEKAGKRLVDIEELTEEVLTLIKKYDAGLSELAEDEKDLHSSHSLDEAQDKHEAKTRQLKKKNNAR